MIIFAVCSFSSDTKVSLNTTFEYVHMYHFISFDASDHENKKAELVAKGAMIELWLVYENRGDNLIDSIMLATSFYEENNRCK